LDIEIELGAAIDIIRMTIMPYDTESPEPDGVEAVEPLPGAESHCKTVTVAIGVAAGKVV
jgi:hypothetical protein